MSSTQTPRGEQATDNTVQRTLTGTDVEDDDIDLGRMSGVPMVLWLIGEQLDDPDPVRVSKWIVRLQAEGVV